MNYPDVNPTWGLRYYNGHFHLYLMWMHWNTGYWTATRTVSRRYKTLDIALKELADIQGAFIIFPV
jgi:hypothetical protein